MPDHGTKRAHGCVNLRQRERHARPRGQARAPALILTHQLLQTMGRVALHQHCTAAVQSKVSAGQGLGNTVQTRLEVSFTCGQRRHARSLPGFNGASEHGRETVDCLSKGKHACIRGRP